MTAPEVLDPIRYLAAWLPKTLKTEDGVSHSISWYDELEDMTDRTVAVYGTIRPFRPRLEMQDRRNRRTLTTGASVTDTFTYSAATAQYPVTQRDIASVTQVLATVGGVPDTVIAASNYETAEYAVNGPDWWTPSAIQFIGPTLPDEGTDFDVTYVPRLVERKGQQRWDRTYRLCLHASRKTVGATTYPKSRLGEQLLESLLAFLATNRGKLLVSGLKVRGFDPLHSITISEGENRSRHFVDVYLQRAQEYLIETTQRIGHVVATTETLP